ncbi:MAG: hypothetical protein CL670_04760 [Balneola sp.]|jgi:hypothetical protein|nr:hypothetical protein [Balneola sp.]MBE78442.1 hypothetical protein [Balneola sp.]|tara:strand:- start:110 stop:808 length:699 start_codon:yes stop_codon:yes gene_type:complete
MKSGIKHLNEWLIVVVIVILGSVGGSFFWGNGMVYNPINLFNPNPGVILLGLETIAAIDIFAGEVPNEIEVSFETLSVLFSMLLLLIVGPWLLYKGYKEYEKGDPSKFKPWYWFVGASLSVISLASIPVLIISFQVFQNTKASADKNRVQDLMRQELQMVGFAVAEYGILEDGFDESFGIEDLELGVLQFEYSVEGTPSDSSIIIVSKKIEENSGKRIKVMPFSPEVMSYRN